MGLSIQPFQNPADSIKADGGVLVEKWSVTQLTTKKISTSGTSLSGDELYKMVKPGTTKTVQGI